MSRRSSVTSSRTAFPINLYDVLGRGEENGDRVGGEGEQAPVLFETLRCAENGDNLIFWEGPPYRTCIRGQWRVLDGYGSRDRGARAHARPYTTVSLFRCVHADISAHLSRPVPPLLSIFSARFRRTRAFGVNRVIFRVIAELNAYKCRSRWFDDS